VQFFTFGPAIQATVAGLSLIFLGWVAFATVNVIFKDRIIADKEHRYRQMQATYENRVADLQISYDALNGALVAAEDRFKSTADALEDKQKAIASFIARESEVQAGGSALRAAPAPLPKLDLSGGTAGTESNGAAMDSALDEGEGNGAVGSSQSLVPPGPAVPRPRAAPEKSSLLEHDRESLNRDHVLSCCLAARSYGAGGGSVSTWYTFPDRALMTRAWKRVAAFFALPSETAPLPESIVFSRNPRLRVLAQQTGRLARAGGSETLLLASAEDKLQQGIGNLRRLIRDTGIDPDRFAGRLDRGVGGPEIPIEQVRIQGVADPRFTRAYLGAAAVLDRLGSLSQAVGRIPLAAPVNERHFDRSSGFGPRIDPFSGRIAFHPGVDFAGAWGAAVHATAPGTVVFAGNRGAYGNMVEIDHGNGIHTRYGHLSAVTVRAGMHVGRGTAIGRVGSTGRSTGPHVHYEVWYDDVVRNPSNFIEAGRHVL
jgi:murein DD-endopeptidase MepM/ murein hydrolase activator NlpD